MRNTRHQAAETWLGRWWSRRAGWALALVALGLTIGSVPARSQSINPDLWGVDNTVTALARAGNTLYVGGAFNWVGPCTGGLVALPKHSSAPLTSFPKVTGYVYGIAADGQGGWFISGNFTAVGGVPRYCFAHILADGSVAPWNPNPNYVPFGAGGLLVSGNTVYVTGGFATISGKSRLYVAALDATTGEALDWNAHADGFVVPGMVHGRVLYVGGLFNHIGGEARHNIAALDVTTGNATSWDPSADGEVDAVVLWGKRLYVCGAFHHIGGKARTALAQLDPETGLATDWNPNVEPANNSHVITMAVHGGRLYLGGYFKSVAGQPRQSLAAFDLTTLELTDWNPGSEFPKNGFPIVYALRSDGRSIYAGGQFDAIGGKSRHYAAELDARTGAATDWDPEPEWIAYAFGFSDDLVCMGGEMRSVRTVPRHNLAAFDLTTGRVTDWSPNLDGIEVNALAASGSRLFVGGAFWNAGGKPRSMLAALDTLSGAATDWNPNADDLVNTLLVRGDVVYAGGNFNHIGGQPRSYLAALDATTGSATAWNPAPNDYVEALTAIGTTIYAGGWFRLIGGADRSGAAALDAVTGAVLPWRADTRSVVDALTSIGNTVYLGGPFEQVNGQPRNGLAAVDGATGALLPWDPNPSGPRESGFYTSIHTLAAHGNAVFVGGDFTQIGGQAHASLAALDGVTGAALDWDPNPDQSVWSLDATSDRLFAGGFFQAAKGVPHLAMMSVSYPDAALAQGGVLGVPLLLARAVTLEPVAPNPVRSSAAIRYRLPAATPVSLAVYDLQGRRVQALVERELQPAGDHEVRLAAARWPAGCYLYRLDAAGVTLTRKFVVIR
jgi:hypothetical protein